MLWMNSLSAVGPQVGHELPWHLVEGMLCLSSIMSKGGQRRVSSLRLVADHASSIMYLLDFESFWSSALCIGRLEGFNVVKLLMYSLESGRYEDI
jgi:hypothetical protein